MRHSIIIPHRNREATLRWTLWSIARSAVLHPECDVEVIIAEPSTGIPSNGYALPFLVRCVQAAMPDHRVQGNLKSVFCKGLLQNAALDVATGDYITFIDADVLVGKDFVAAAQEYLEGTGLTRLCYQVRHLILTQDRARNTAAVTGWLDISPDREALVDGWFATWTEWKQAFEGFDCPECKSAAKTKKASKEGIAWGPDVFGNSHWSIRSDVLGDLRFDEEYIGAGHEDLEMIDRIWCQHGKNYQAAFLAIPETGILHIKHPRGQSPEWRHHELQKHNSARYTNQTRPRRRAAGLPIR